MFLYGISDQGISTQIAGLINDYNGLAEPKTRAAILQSRTDYVVETHGKLVIAAVGLNKNSYTLTEIKHLVVRPEWRKKGVAQFVTKRALSLVTTPMAYATIRENNIASLKLFEKLGFIHSGKYSTKDHQVILLTKAAPGWQKRLDQSWKPGSSFEQTTNEMQGTQGFSPMFESWMDDL